MNEFHVEIVVAAGVLLNILVVVIGNSIAFGQMRQAITDLKDAVSQLREEVAEKVDVETCKAYHVGIANQFEAVRREMNSRRSSTTPPK